MRVETPQEKQGERERKLPKIQFMILSFSLVFVGFVRKVEKNATQETEKTLSIPREKSALHDKTHATGTWSFCF